MTRLDAIQEALNRVCDGNFTPLVVVKTDVTGLVLPVELKRNSSVMLNISAKAVRQFVLTEQGMGFFTRFGGVDTMVTVPLNAILAVVSAEGSEVFHLVSAGDVPVGSVQSPAAVPTEPAARPVFGVIQGGKK